MKNPGPIFQVSISHFSHINISINLYFFLTQTHFLEIIKITPSSISSTPFKKGRFLPFFGTNFHIYSFTAFYYFINKHFYSFLEFIFKKNGKKNQSLYVKKKVKQRPYWLRGEIELH